MNALSSTGRLTVITAEACFGDDGKNLEDILDQQITSMKRENDNELLVFIDDLLSLEFLCSSSKTALATLAQMCHAVSLNKAITTLL